jgi:hypothetical protein
LSFFSVKKTKKDSLAVVTPVQQRFSLENLVTEEANRRRIAKEIAGNASSDEGEEIGTEMNALFDINTMAELKSMMEEAKQKTTDDLDLQPFFHRWTIDSLRGFNDRVDLKLPDCLVQALRVERELQHSVDFVNVILKGDWICSLFPTRCPESLARWLFSCICYGDDSMSASAWDAWTYYFGRTALWDPDDASFGWFREGVSHRASIDWVPDWKLIVETLGNFGAPTAPYIEVKYTKKKRIIVCLIEQQKGVAYTSSTVGARFIRDTPPCVDRALRPVFPSAALAASFPSSRLRRLFSLLGLCFYASAFGHLFAGESVYTPNQASLLVQISLSCLVDPLLVSQPRREFTQCIAAAVELYNDDYMCIVNLCDYVTLAAPHEELQPLICALGLFSPSTQRAQWLRRCLSFWVSSQLLEERIVERHDGKTKEFQMPSMQNAILGPAKMLKEMCLFLEALRNSFTLEKPKGRDYVWLFGLLVCLDLTLGDRSAIVASEHEVNRVSELLKEVQESFRSGEEMNEFASASRTAISLMKERINYNIKFEKNRAESIARYKAANAIGGARQTELVFTPMPKK